MLLANIVLARTLSVAEFGLFGFAIALATILAIPASGGLSMLLTREIAGYSQSKNWPAYRGLIRFAYRWVAAGSVIVGLGVWIWILWWKPPGNTALWFILLLVPFLGLNGICVGILKGLGKPLLAEVPQQVVQTTLMILGYMVLAGLGLSTATYTLLWYLTAVVVKFFLASIMLWKAQPAGICNVVALNEDLPRWRSAILPFVILSAATTLTAQIAILMLGFAGMEEAVAEMRVAERGAQLVLLPMAFLNSIIGPYFVDALSKDDPIELRRITRFSARLTLLASAPQALILILFGRDLIAWTFGTPYDVLSYTPMVILIGGQVVSVLLGNGGMLLVMGGHERQTLYSLLLSLVVIIGLCLLLIGPLGAVGAAIGVSAGIITAKTYVYVAVRRSYKISTAII